MCQCDESDFLTGNFSHKFSSTCCAFRMNDDFCPPRRFKSLYSRFCALLTLVVTSGCKTGYYNLPIFISFVKLIVVMNINVQSKVRSQNGSCDWTAPVVDSCNFLRFYCPPRSLESLSVFFPSTFKFIQGQACGNSHCNRPFSKIL